MRDAGYGRIIFTASAAGIYGNFGQANYAMAKLGLVGPLEHARDRGQEEERPRQHDRADRRLAPDRDRAARRSSSTRSSPSTCRPLVAWLCHESCEETGGLFEVGGGFFAQAPLGARRGQDVQARPRDRARGARARVGRDRRLRQGDAPDATSPQSMQPILGNLEHEEQGRQRVHRRRRGARLRVARRSSSSYDERDLALYALGVGAAQNPLDAKELAATSTSMHGDGFQALPTFAVIPALNVDLRRWRRRASRRPGSTTASTASSTASSTPRSSARCRRTRSSRTRRRSRTSSTRARTRVVVTAITHATTRAARSSSTTSSRRSCAAPAAGAASAARRAEVNVAPDRAPDAVVDGEDRATTRRSSIASPATGTRSTPTRRSRKAFGFEQADPARALHVRLRRART